MRKPTPWILIGIAAAVTAGCAWLLLATPDADKPTPNTPGGPSEADAGQVEPATNELPQANSPASSAIAGARTALEPAELSPQEPASDVTHAVVAGRCIDETGEPLRDAVVIVRLGRPTSAWIEARLAEGLEWRDALHHKTDELGRFRCAFAAVPDTPFKLELLPTAPHVRCRFDELQLGVDEKLDLGEILLPAGGSLRGTLVDTNNQPVGNVHVRFLAQAPRIAPPEFGRFDHIAGTNADADGAFVVAGPLAPGSWQASAIEREMADPETSVIEVDGTKEGLRLVVTSLATADTIRGVVVTDNDLPIEGVIVSAPTGGGALIFQALAKQGAQQSEPTDAAGRFTLRRRADASTGPVRLWVRGPGQPLQMPDEFAWNEENVRLVVPRKARIRIRAEEAATGQPLRVTSLLVSHQGRGSRHFQALSPAAGDPPGESVFAGIDPGDVLLHFLVNTKGTAAPPVARVTLIRGEESLVTLSLPRSAERSIRVTSNAGEPVPQAKISIFDDPNLSEPDARIVAGLAGWSMHSWPTDRARIPAEIVSSVTNPDGRGRILGPADRAVSLMVHGKGWHHVTPNVRLDDPGTLEVVVPEPARVVLNLTPKEAVHPDPALRMESPKFFLRRVRQPGESYEPEVFATPDDSGRAEFSALGPGTWDVGIRNITRRGVSTIGVDTMIRQFADLKLGETREVDLDLSDFVPRLVTGRVQLNGKPAGRTELHFTRIDETTEAPLARWGCTTNLQGEFSLPLRAGRWTPTIEVAGSPTLRPQIRTQPAILVVADTAITDLSLTAAATMGACIFRNHDGTPAVGTRIRWTREADDTELHGVSAERTDSLGRVQLFQAPGRYRAHVLNSKLLKAQPHEIFTLGEEDRAARIAAMWTEVGTLELIAGDNQAVPIFHLPEESKD